MSNIKKGIIGYFLFFLTIAFNAGLAVVIYSLIKDKDDMYVAVFLLFFIAYSSILCIVIDIIRRKFTVDKPVREIREATNKMAKGDFNIKLIPTLSAKNYNTYDLIKMDLNLLALELSKNEVLKTDFISNVSHEIKTPLAVIQNYAKVLENDKLDEETRLKYLDSLQEACQKLSNLVTNILKLNKLENQKIIPEYKEFNLSESIINRVLSYESLIEKKNIELICDIKEDIIINSEESYLEIIWNNLISNAIKFTEKNGTITITLNKIGSDIIFTIKDTGCGIDNETGKHIFDKFYQGDTSHSKEGNGLGLALVKKVIDSLGGNISIQSELGVGTTFVVELKEN